MHQSRLELSFAADLFESHGPLFTGSWKTFAEFVGMYPWVHEPSRCGRPNLTTKAQWDYGPGCSVPLAMSANDTWADRTLY